MAFQDVILGDNPEIYWRMDDVALATMLDSSGHGRHVTFTGNKPPINKPGAFPGSFSRWFTNSPARFATADPILRGNAPWTVEWFESADAGYTQYVWALGGTSTAPDTYVRLEHYTGSVMGMTVWTGTELLINNPGPPPDQFGNTQVLDHWFYYALRYDGSLLTLFRDGLPVGACVRDIEIPAVGNLQFRLGTGWGSSAAESIHDAWAYLDEVAVFASALSDATIAFHARAYEPRALGFTADALVTVPFAPPSSNATIAWLGGRRQRTLGGSDPSEFRLWLGGEDPADLAGFAELGQKSTVTADAYLPLEVTGSGWLVTELSVATTADGLLIQDRADCRADGLVVDGGRATPLAPVGRSAPLPPVGRSTPTIP